jgi:signal transduction histidine kinase
MIVTHRLLGPGGILGDIDGRWTAVPTSPGMGGRTVVQRYREFSRRHTVAVDSAIALVLFASSLLADVQTGRLAGVEPADRNAALIVQVLTFAALAVRRRWPTPVLCATLAGSGVSMILTGGPGPVVAAVVLAVYTVGVATDRRSTAIAGGASAAALIVLAGVTSGSWAGPDKLALLAWPCLAAALGDAVRTQRAYVGAVEERARRAEESREEAARRRVMEERVRIARELHDVIAHHVAVVSVQAGVAAHLLSSDQDAAREALRNIRSSSRTVLDELRNMVGVLRMPDDPVDPTSPTPGLAQIADLVQSFVAAGLHATWSLSGEPRELSSAVELAAYRVVQEALTNAQKYGPGTAAVNLTYTERELRIEISNVHPVLGAAHATIGKRADGTGHGILGMRERATSLGGTLRAGPGVDGVFRVTSTLPLTKVRNQ